MSTKQASLEEIRALTQELEESVRALKRVVAEDREKSDNKANDPEDILSELESDA